MTGKRLSYIEQTSYSGSRARELAREIRRCWVQREANHAAIRLVLEGFDKGIFTRDTSHDHESGWAVRLLPYLNALGHLARATGQEGAKK